MKCEKCGERMHQSIVLDELWCDCGFTRHWKERHKLKMEKKDG